MNKELADILTRLSELETIFIEQQDHAGAHMTGSIVADARGGTTSFGNLEIALEAAEKRAKKNASGIQSSDLVAE